MGSKKKPGIRESIFEGICEVLVELLLMGIGVVIVIAFCGNAEQNDTDYTLIGLIGIVAVLLVVGAAVNLVRRIIKRFKKASMKSGDDILLQEASEDDYDENCTNR